MVQKFSELIPKQDLTTLQETFGDPAKIESEAKRIAGDISVQVDRPTAIQDAATVFDTGKVDGARDFSTRELPKPGLTQQERADQAALSAAEADLATQTPEAIAKRTGDQAEATRLALLRREKTVRTAEGEAGQKIARGVAAAEQKRAGQAGVQASAVAGATELRQIGAKKTLDAALAADPELNKLRNRITTLNTALTKASRTEFTDSIRTALTNAQKKIDELTVDSQEAKKSDNAKLATALADADTLLAIANDPTGNAVDALQKAFPNAEFDKAAILGQAQLQKIIADFESKKALSSSEQLKLDQAKADLAKTKAQTAQIGKKATTREQNIASLNNLLDKGTITQEQFDKALAEEIDIGAPTPLDEEKARDLKLKNDIAEKEARQLNNTIGLGDIGTGNITQSYGDTKTDEKTLLADGRRGHPGDDIDGNNGNLIPAVRGGKVISVINDAAEGDLTANNGFGNEIIIETDDGLQFKYAHLNEFTGVNIGDTVKQGQTIGQMGNTGRVFNQQGKSPTAGDKETGAHLHLEVFDKNWKDKPGMQSGLINPRQFMSLASTIPASFRDLTTEQSGFIRFVDSGKLPATVDKTNKAEVTQFIKNAENFRGKFRERTSEFDEFFDLFLSNTPLGVGVSDADREIKISNFRNAALKGDLEDVKRVTRAAILGEKKDTDFDNLETLSRLLTNSENLMNGFTPDQKKEAAEALKTGLLGGSIEKGIQKLGRTTDPQLAELKSQLDLILVDFIKTTSGTAVNDNERKALKEIMADISNGTELNTARIKAFRSNIETKRDTPLKLRLGEEKFNKLFGADFRSFTGAPKTPITPETRLEKFKRAKKTRNDSKFKTDLGKIRKKRKNG